MSLFLKKFVYIFIFKCWSTCRDLNTFSGSFLFFDRPLGPTPHHRGILGHPRYCYHIESSGSSKAFFAKSNRSLSRYWGSPGPEAGSSCRGCHLQVHQISINNLDASRVASPSIFLSSLGLYVPIYKSADGNSSPPSFYFVMLAWCSLRCTSHHSILTDNQHSGHIPGSKCTVTWVPFPESLFNHSIR